MNALKKAIECLRIHDIWQHDVTASTSESIEDLGRFPERHEIQFKHIVLRSLWGRPDEADTGPYIFRVYIKVGARFVSADSGSEKATRTDEATVLARIEATYATEYRAEINPGQQALKDFALRNASFHIWPYWREFLASQCSRMNLPKVSLPLQALASNHSKQPIK